MDTVELEIIIALITPIYGVIGYGAYRQEKLLKSLNDLWHCHFCLLRHMQIPPDCSKCTELVQPNLFK